MKKFQETFANIEKQLTELQTKACCGVECCEDKNSCDCSYLISDLRRQLGWMQDEVNSLWRDFYEYKQSALPPILGADKLANALKVLGIDGDYEVQPRVIYASDSGKPQSVKLTITKAQSKE